LLSYTAPAWLPGGHLQTIWPALAARRVSGAPVRYRRERWNTPDADFIDIDWLLRQPDADSAAAGVAASGQTAVRRSTLMVLFHGLEGSSASHYAQAFAEYARERAVEFAVVHFRGCSGELNLAPRAYHSGDFEEIEWVLQRFRAGFSGPIVAVGVSLGGNALMRWAGETGAVASRVVQALASVCAPLDLAAGGHAIGRGFNRQVYTRMFLRTMKPKALRKLAQHPGLFDRAALLRARNLYEFDNIFTAPLHGFASTEDYWARASAKPHLSRIGVPSLVVNARNDPFVPASSLPVPGEVSRSVLLWQPADGGHVGFPQGQLPGHVRALPQIVGGWLLEHVS
jgi:uncharacterized protein